MTRRCGTSRPSGSKRTRFGASATRKPGTSLNHAHAVALHFAHYNFCRVHATLTKAAKGIYRTPAMAAGRTDHVWTVADLVALLDQDAIA